jgi:hypothetical protein
VKGGGHSRNPGDSNSVGGVTVDLNRLSGVEILQGDTRARVGGGATTVKVYEALESQNLSFVGGRVGSVGMGGFTLGGGTSPFSNKYGWSLDNVYEYEVRSTFNRLSIIQPLTYQPRLSSLTERSRPLQKRTILTSILPSVAAAIISELSQPSLFELSPKALSLPVRQPIVRISQTKFSTKSMTYTQTKASAVIGKWDTIFTIRTALKVTGSH